MQRLASFAALSLICLASILGFAVAGHGMAGLATAPLVAYLWARASTRLIAGAVALAYYLGATRDLPLGAFAFFGDDAFSGSGYVLWMTICVALAMPWMALWSRPARGYGYYAWRVPLILALLALPPLGVFGLANPLTAAGALFPGVRWTGLALTLVLTVAYACAAARSPRVLAILLCVHVGAFSYGWHYDEPVSPWQGVNTAYGRLDEPGQDVFMRAHSVHRLLGNKVGAAAPGATLIFPETIIGLWTQAAADFWTVNVLDETARTGKNVLLSGLLPHADGTYESILIAVGSSIRLVYAQRVPVPISMWKPFSPGGARANWLDAGVFEFAGKRVAAFVCYEQLLVWPVVLSFMHEPQVVIAVSNGWWARDTSIPTAQLTAMRAWARLFGTPLVFAANR